MKEIWKAIENIKEHQAQIRHETERIGIPPDSLVWELLKEHNAALLRIDSNMAALIEDIRRIQHELRERDFTKPEATTDSTPLSTHPRY